MFSTHEKNVISLCGVDGMGKTTLIQYLKKDGYPTLRTPQVHESGEFKVSALSVGLEKLSQYYDMKGDRIGKACVLFLAMGLQPKAELELGTVPLLFRERDPILDLLVYSPIYLNLLKPDVEFIPPIEESAVRGAFELQMDLLKINDYKKLPGALLQFFSLPPTEWIARIELEWQITKPAWVFLLKGNEVLIDKRLKAKHVAATSEFHEQTPILLHLQSELEKVGKAISEKYRFRFQVIEVSDEETIESLARSVVGYLA